jgi:hypothetical protein
MDVSPWLTIVPRPFRSPWAGRGYEIGRPRVAKGQRGTAIDVPPRKWVSFSRDPPPASSAATISKMPLNPPRSSPTDSTGVAIPNAKTLTEYDAVALELVREHPWLTETGSRQRPRQPAFSGSHLQVGLAAPMAASSGPAVPKIVARRLAQCTCLRCSYWAVGWSVDRHAG